MYIYIYMKYIWYIYIYEMYMTCIWNVYIYMTYVWNMYDIYISIYDIYIIIYIYMYDMYIYIYILYIYIYELYHISIYWHIYLSIDLSIYLPGHQQMISKPHAQHPTSATLSPCQQHVAQGRQVHTGHAGLWNVHPLLVPRDVTWWFATKQFISVFEDVMGNAMKHMTYMTWLHEIIPAKIT